MASLERLGAEGLLAGCSLERSERAGQSMLGGWKTDRTASGGGRDRRWAGVGGGEAAPEMLGEHMEAVPLQGAVVPRHVEAFSKGMYVFGGQPVP